jgi:ABC-type glycerol-3-phosphate transport system permease component
MAYAVLATLPMMLAFTFGQRWIVASVAATGARG